MEQCPPESPINSDSHDVVIGNHSELFTGYPISEHDCLYLNKDDTTSREASQMTNFQGCSHLPAFF